MTTYSKAVTINLGNYESLRIGVSDAPSFEECDNAIISHLKIEGIEVDETIRRALLWNGKK